MESTAAIQVGLVRSFRAEKLNVYVYEDRESMGKAAASVIAVWPSSEAVAPMIGSLSVDSTRPLRVVWPPAITFNVAFAVCSKSWPPTLATA